MLIPELFSRSAHPFTFRENSQVSNKKTEAVRASKKSRRPPFCTTFYTLTNPSKAFPKRCKKYTQTSYVPFKKNHPTSTLPLPTGWQRTHRAGKHRPGNAYARTHAYLRVLRDRKKNTLPPSPSPSPSPFSGPCLLSHETPPRGKTEAGAQ